MFEITVKSSNEQSRTVAVEAINEAGRTTTIADICIMDAVIDFFDAEPDEIIASLTCVGGTEITGGLRDRLMGAAVQEGDVLEFDIEVDEDEDEEDAEAPTQTAAPTTGTCAVEIGFNRTNITITNGQTSVYDVIHNQAVRANSGLTEAQLTACTVMLETSRNGSTEEAEVTDANLKTKTVYNGDILRLTARDPHSKA